MSKVVARNSKSRPDGYRDRNPKSYLRGYRRAPSNENRGNYTSEDCYHCLRRITHSATPLELRNSTQSFMTLSQRTSFYFHLCCSNYEIRSPKSEIRRSFGWCLLGPVRRS